MDHISENIKVVIGAEGINNNPGWIHTDQHELSLLNRNDWIKRFSPNSIHTILAEHVWEHLTYEEGIQAAIICHEFLQPGGFIRCAVPDGHFPDPAYQQIVQVGGPGPPDHPAASHQIVYTHTTITAMFEAAGFDVTLLEYFDKNGQFQYHDWNEQDGFIYRSKRFDHRNQDGNMGFTSLIVDAGKPKTPTSKP
nr:SAM-dependent methyltransferase [Baia soyae]